MQNFPIHLIDGLKRPIAEFQDVLMEEMRISCIEIHDIPEA
jgi:hypothetical protein